jgi:hypothetical protein
MRRRIRRRRKRTRRTTNRGLFRCVLRCSGAEARFSRPWDCVRLLPSRQSHQVRRHCRSVPRPSASPIPLQRLGFPLRLRAPTCRSERRRLLPVHRRRLLRLSRARLHPRRPFRLRNSLRQLQAGPFLLPPAQYPRAPRAPDRFFLVPGSPCRPVPPDPDSRARQLNPDLFPRVPGPVCRLRLPPVRMEARPRERLCIRAYPVKPNPDPSFRR